MHQPRRNAALVLTILTAGSMMLFQNCGGAFDPQHSAGGFHHLEYPFAKAPLVYSDQKMKLESLDMGSQLVYVASLASPIGETVEYEIAVRNGIGQSLCPSQRGVLAEGQSTVEVNCVSLKDLRGAQIELKVTTPSGSETQVSIVE